VGGPDSLFDLFRRESPLRWKRKEKYDGLGVACAEVGLAFTTVVLITGRSGPNRHGEFIGLGMRG